MKSDNAKFLQWAAGVGAALLITWVGGISRAVIEHDRKLAVQDIEIAFLKQKKDCATATKAPAVSNQSEKFISGPPQWSDINIFFPFVEKFFGLKRKDHQK